MTTRTVQKYRVFTKRLWFDAWTERTSLYCLTCVFETSPNISEASFKYNFGRVMREDALTHDTSDPLDIVGHFVKVEIDQDGDPAKKWIGTITDDTQDRHANQSDRRLKTGVQFLRALGFEYLLARQFVYGAYSSTYPQPVGRGLPFNRGGGSIYDSPGSITDGLGNRDEGGAQFEGDFADIGDTQWTAGQIVDYLLANFAPKSADDLPAIRFELSPEGFALLDAQKPSLETDGRSVKELLDQMIDRRRLMAWFLSFDAADRCIVNVFTMNANLFTLPNGTVIPRNANTKNYYFDDEPGSIRSVTLTRDATQKYDRVTARGERVVYCDTFVLFNASQSSTTSVPRLRGVWESSDVTAYNNAGSTDAEYTALDNDFDRLRYIEEARAQPVHSATFKRFYAVTANFDEMEAFFPSFANREESTRVYAPGLRFLPYIPFRAGLTYTGSTPPTDDSSLEYQRPLVVGVIEGSPTRVALLDSYSRAEFNDDTLKFAGMQWAIEVRPTENLFGVDLVVVGAPQHVIARGLYSPPTAIEQAAGTPGLFKCGDDQMAVTLAFAADEHATVKWPEGDLPGPIDYVRELTIPVPGAGATFIADGTIYGLTSPSQVLRTTAGLWVRDDTAKLQAVARSAYEWYIQGRVAIEVTDNRIECDFDRGQLITGIGSPGALAENANTCVTRIAFDFQQSTSTVTTQFVDLDLGV